MSIKDKPPKSTGKLVEIAINALTEHEHELDRLVNRLTIVKNDFSVNLKKVGTMIDAINRNLEDLESEIYKLKHS